MTAAYHHWQISVLLDKPCEIFYQCGGHQGLVSARVYYFLFHGYQCAVAGYACSRRAESRMRLMAPFIAPVMAAGSQATLSLAVSRV